MSHFIKINHPEHGAMVGNGHGFHIIFRGPLKQAVETDGAIQQTELGVQVKVDKGR
jgi:hypothetical protein